MWTPLCLQDRTPHPSASPGRFFCLLSTLLSKIDSGWSCSQCDHLLHQEVSLKMRLGRYTPLSLTYLISTMSFANLFAWFRPSIPPSASQRKMTRFLLHTPFVIVMGLFLLVHQYLFLRGASFMLPWKASTWIKNFGVKMPGNSSKQFKTHSLSDFWQASRPDRWDNLSDTAANLPGLFSNTLTFSAGPRVRFLPLPPQFLHWTIAQSCIGMRFSMIEIKTFLYILLTNFVFRPTEDTIIKANV